MKKPNLELNNLKLGQKKLQLAAITQQHAELASKLEQVKARLELKALEVSNLETLVNSLQTTVSK